jgi:hypothetical protein
MKARWVPSSELSSNTLLAEDYVKGKRMAKRTAEQTMTKLMFVKKQPWSMSPLAVVAAAKAVGIEVTSQYVSNYRWQKRKNDAAAKKKKVALPKHVPKLKAVKAYDKWEEKMQKGTVLNIAQPEAIPPDYEAELRVLVLKLGTDKGRELLNTLAKLLPDTSTGAEGREEQFLQRALQVGTVRVGELLASIEKL